MGRLHSNDGIEPRDWDAISPTFGGFLPHFVRETIRCGGTVYRVPEVGRVEGLLLLERPGGVASVFAESIAVANALVSVGAPRLVFSERALDGPSDSYLVYRRHGAISGVGPPLRHRVRTTVPSDAEAVHRLLTAELGAVDARWFHDLPTDAEYGFAVDVDGKLAGVAFVLHLGRRARLHSLAVAPRYRRLGIGADLVAARLLWCGRRGSTDLLSEIAEENRPSRILAERAGFVPDGRLFLYRRGGPSGVEAARPSEPH